MLAHTCLFPGIMILSLV